MLKSCLAGACLAALANAALAGTADDVRITAVDTRSNGYFLVTLSAPVSSSPACATDPSRMSGDLNTAGGRALFDTATGAYTRSVRVTITGTRTCTQFSQIESIYSIFQSSGP
jgi:hypothetical protein